MTISAVTLAEQPAVPTAVLRRDVAPRDLAHVVPECCGAVWTALRAQGLRGGRNIALYLDDAIHLEAGVECSVPFEPRDGVVRSELPAGLVAIVTHHGPYGRLGEAHDAVVAWCRAHGHRLAGPRWEVYDHWDQAWDKDPSRIRTDVSYQVIAS